MKKNERFDSILAAEKSAFLIDLEKFEQNLQELHQAFLAHYPKVTIGYSYKTNYTPQICKIAHKNSCYAEVVSEMEVEMAMKNLTDKSEIIYNGPIKSYDSLEKVINVGGIINIDNHLDVEKIEQILSSKPNLTAKVAIRLSFDYGENCSRFGLDLDSCLLLEQELLSNRQIELLGFHFHLPFRNIESFKFRLECLLKTINQSKNPNLRYINIGGGFFGKLDEELVKLLGITEAPTYKDYGKLIGETLSSYFNDTDKEFPTLYLEPGSSVVADVMSFITKIHAVKTIQNRNYLVTYAGRHLLSPTNKTMELPLEIIEKETSGNPKEYLVAGFTCIEGDIIGKGMASEKIDPYNAIVEIKNVGSYSIVMGSDFILPQPAIYSFTKNHISLIRKAKSIDEVYNSFSS